MAFHRNALLFVVLLPASVQLASASIVVPAGFEDLAKTQRLWTEVSLYGASLGLFEADITLETVTFVAPETLIAAIKRQFNDDPALIASVTGALSSPLARNGNLACSSNGSAAGCDFIDTKSVALIYDENNARINLFFDRRYLPKQTAENQWYQPTRNTENALIHQQNINFVADEDYQSMTVQGNGALAMTENGYFNLDWTWLGQRSRHQQQQEITVNPVRYALSIPPVRYKEATVSYVVLDNNRFYAEGLRYALLRRNVMMEVHSGTVQWQPLLLESTTLVIRCRFSISGTHQSLVDILLSLEAHCWRGTGYLVCNEKSWGLATYLRKRFETLTLHIIDDRISVADAAWLLSKEPRRIRTLRCCLTEMEFNVLDRLVKGQSVRYVAHMTKMSEKQVSTYKCNALKKLNANNLLQLLV